MTNLKKFEALTRDLANKWGLDLQRYRPEASQLGRLATMLAHQEIGLVVDVGANTGQFSQALRKAGYTGPILSIEPMSKAHAELVNVSRHDPQWTIAPPMALGDADGEADVHIAGNSVSSSLLPMLDAHEKAAPASAYVGSEKVAVRRLDRLVADHMGDTLLPLFVKIDTQGYEDKVLDGADGILKNVKSLQMELSLVELYAGQQLFGDLVGRMLREGFAIWAIWPGFCDPVSGRMLQVDVVFSRPESSSP